jgi:hypothetical protein
MSVILLLGWGAAEKKRSCVVVQEMRQRNAGETAKKRVKTKAEA